jgi:hypothetical protein
MIQNLEFIADKEALKNITDKKSLSANPLKITTKENCGYHQSFYQSLIKKIIMLNKINQNQFLKYAFGAALVVTLYCYSK